MVIEPNPNTFPPYATIPKKFPGLLDTNRDLFCRLWRQRPVTLRVRSCLLVHVADALAVVDKLLPPVHNGLEMLVPHEDLGRHRSGIGILGFSVGVVRCECDGGLECYALRGTVSNSPL